jgi:chromosome segregation ATPase
MFEDQNKQMATLETIQQSIEGLAIATAKGFSEVNVRLDRIEGDVAILKDDVAILKVDVAILKDDVAILKDDVSNLKIEMKEVKGGLFELNSKVDNLAKSNKEDIDILSSDMIFVKKKLNVAI